MARKPKSKPKLRGKSKNSSAREPNLRHLGALVRSLREDRGYTRQQLARRGDLSVQTLRRLEGGEISPTLKTLAKVCSGLKIELSTLLAALEQEGDRDLAREISLVVEVCPEHKRAQLLRVLTEIIDNFFGE